MKNSIRVVFGGLAVSLLAIIISPMFAKAQVPTAQLVVVTQTSNLSPVPPSSVIVNVIGTGPSLTSVPTAIGTLAFASSFNSDTRVITMVPGTYNVSVPNVNGYAFTYGANCTGSLSAGETRTCYVTASAGGTSYVTVNTNIQNRNGGTRSASDFVITVSGTNASASSIQGWAGSTQVSMGPGAYAINVSTSNGYTVTRTDGCSGSIGVGETRQCTLTISDVYLYNNTGGYPYSNNPLVCTPSNQTVYRGATVTFSATGGRGTYTWATADRVFLNIGSVLNTQLLTSGDQAAYVTSGTETATCLVKVLPSAYGTGGVVLGTNTAAPGLPNTGFAPSTFSLLLALFAAFVALPTAVFALYPHAKRTASHFTR